jgi:DNA (cytosine-5)-methyltransferase 1
VSRPRMLDDYCGAGGAAMGYHRAGFDVVGVDNRPQPHYPFEFIQADGLEVLADADFLAGFDAIHASPPCQAYTQSSLSQRLGGREYPDLVGPTRDLLELIGKLWVIENVPGAPIRADYKLCGCVVGLKHLKRERWFETSWHGFQLRPPCHHPDPIISVVGHGTPSWMRGKFYGRDVYMADRKAAMGIDWMNRGELSQAIPPAYTQFIGEQLIDALVRAA